jgi:hypothetical protein
MIGAEYMNKMQSLGDEMATTRRTLKDEELVEYILTGIGPEYDPIVSVVIAKETLVSISELYSQLLAFETRLTLMGTQEGGGSSANPAYHGHGHSNHGGGGCDGFAEGSRGGYNCGGGRGGFSCDRHNTGNDKHPICQACKKRGHMADRCWHRFEEDYVPNERTAVVASGP